MKKYIVTVVIAVICLSLVVAGTIAYNTVTEKAINIVTMGNIKIAGMESGNTRGSALTIVPGVERNWSFWVENRALQPAYVRVSVDSVFTLASGVSRSKDQDIVTFEVNSKDWTYKNGFYYYNKQLPVGGKTEPLFTGLGFAKEAGNEYQRATAKLNVFVYAVQVKNNGNNVFEAAGWPAAN